MALNATDGTKSKTVDDPSLLVYSPGILGYITEESDEYVGGPSVLV